MILCKSWDVGLLSSACMFKVAVGGITIFQQYPAASFSSLKVFLDKKEETLLESFY